MNKNAAVNHLKTKKDPKFRLHKPSGRGFVELNGCRRNLGPYTVSRRLLHTDVLAEVRHAPKRCRFRASSNSRNQSRSDR